MDKYTDLQFGRRSAVSGVVFRHGKAPQRIAPAVRRGAARVIGGENIYVNGPYLSEDSLRFVASVFVI